MCDFLLFLGKLVIVLVCGIVSYLSFGGYIPEIKVRGSASPLNSIMVHFFIPVASVVRPWIRRDPDLVSLQDSVLGFESVSKSMGPKQHLVLLACSPSLPHIPVVLAPQFPTYSRCVGT